MSSRSENSTGLLGAPGLELRPHCTIPYYTILHHTILHYTILHETILYYTKLYYTILYETTPQPGAGRYCLCLKTALTKQACSFNPDERYVLRVMCLLFDRLSCFVDVIVCCLELRLQPSADSAYYYYISIYIYIYIYCVYIYIYIYLCIYINI